MSQLKFHNENLGNVPYTELYLIQSQKVKDKCLLKYLGTRDTPCELHFVSKQFIFFFFGWWNTPRACEFSDIALGRCVICSNVLNQLLNSPHANCKSITDTLYKQFHILPFFSALFSRRKRPCNVMNYEWNKLLTLNANKIIPLVCFCLLAIYYEISEFFEEQYLLFYLKKPAFTNSVQ